MNRSGIDTCVVANGDYPIAVCTLSIESAHRIVRREGTRWKRVVRLGSRHITLSFDGRESAIVIQNQLSKIVIAAADGARWNTRTIKDRYGGSERRRYLDDQIANP